MSMMLSPVPSRTIVVSSGNVYVADQYGVIQNVGTPADQADLIDAGCAVLTPPPTDLLGSLLSANFNVGGAGAIGDQIITFPLANNVKYRIRRITVCNTTVNGMSTAVGGLYTAAAKAGSAIVANSQVYTGLTNALTALDLTLALPNLILAAGTPLYFSLTTPQGAPARADLYVYGDVYA
jgi:hypothetical protein